MRLTAASDHVAAAGRSAPRDRAKSTYSGLNRLRAFSSPLARVRRALSSRSH
jgi:hypothetical protein